MTFLRDLLPVGWHWLALVVPHSSQTPPAQARKLIYKVSQLVGQLPMQAFAVVCAPPATARLCRHSPTGWLSLQQCVFSLSTRGHDVRQNDGGALVDGPYGVLPCDTHVSFVHTRDPGTCPAKRAPALTRTFWHFRCVCATFADSQLYSQASPTHMTLFLCSCRFSPPIHLFLRHVRSLRSCGNYCGPSWCNAKVLEEKM